MTSERRTYGPLAFGITFSRESICALVLEIGCIHTYSMSLGNQRARRYETLTLACHGEQDDAIRFLNVFFHEVSDQFDIILVFATSNAHNQTCAQKS